VDVQKQSFREIQRYLESVNEFFRGKKLVVDPSVPRFEGRAVGIRFNQSNRIERLRALSSGERQIVTLIYAATHMSGQKVVLIDEPEISLHVDWQRRLLGKMSEQVGERQIIACTHSPSIGADYAKSQMRIELKPTQEHLVAPYEDSSDAMQERLF
jgi:predicted ATPase